VEVDTTRSANTSVSTFTAQIAQKAPSSADTRQTVSPLGINWWGAQRTAGSRGDEEGGGAILLYGIEINSPLVMPSDCSRPRPKLYS
jgi:hypothetical protein